MSHLLSAYFNIETGGGGVVFLLKNNCFESQMNDNLNTKTKKCTSLASKKGIKTKDNILKLHFLAFTLIEIFDKSADFLGSETKVFLQSQCRI